MRVLVAYATKHGSTEDVAAEIAAVLVAAGVETQLRPAAEVRDMEGLDGVVIGAPLYSGLWHSGAHRFLKRHRALLTGVPVAVFALGPRDVTSEESWTRPREQLRRALAKHASLAPVAVAVFGGVDPPKRNRPAGRDARDWDAIRAWADGLRSALGAGEPGPDV